MRIEKIIKDWLFKAYFQSQKTVPSGLVDLQKYFRHFGPIKFNHHVEDSVIVAVSENFRYGSIVTYGKNEQELDKNIKDAILTTFHIPSSYAKDVDLRRQDVESEMAYAAA